MLSTIRQLLDNWIIRIFFGILIIVFVFWGIANVVTLIGSSTAVATVAGNAVPLAPVQTAYQNEINRYAAQSGGKPPSATLRRIFAGQAVGQAIDRTTMAREVTRLGVAAAPNALRKQIFAIAAFQGTDGKFSKTTFNQVLAENHIAPNQFMAELASSINADQVVQAISAGAIAPTPLVHQLSNFLGQSRSAAYVELPFAAATAPNPPALPVLRRFWRNHPGRFSTPEQRTIQVAVLAPSLLAPTLTVSQAAIAAQYQTDLARYQTPAKRTVEIITAESAASAKTLASAWRGGKDWQAMKKAANAATATAVTFKDAHTDSLPSGRLSKAVFAASPDIVTGPITGAIGTYIFKVTAATPAGATPLAQVADQIKAKLQLRAARAKIDAIMPKLQDALAGNTPLDKMPADLHLTMATVTLDAQGMQPDGTPAAIPGPPALRGAVLKAAFTTAQGAAPAFHKTPGDNDFILSVNKITPPQLKPYDSVKHAVLADWTAHQLEHAQNIAAAQLVSAVKSGQTLAQAASAAGLPVTLVGPFGRSKLPKPLPKRLLPILFALKQGQPTMVETRIGFVVATVTAITPPSGQIADNLHTQLAKVLDNSMQTAILQSFATGLRHRDHVKINAKILHQISS
ncbi:MAG TPA: SurA N-terminal domain-containing protein [Acidiphilium sp.]|nr:MAG: hypothetical protein B7Z67_09115 [Acidiphilium sp. 21-60-14]OYV89832.1 MAG: hypothetical protein B7Z57_11075 [Acidiphilium sp. 37-60-79]HQT88266.1 SurA N-terminal domain-containing protein [Acidiphilium sp.]HQU24676.1 SurA N-terminal domain-containing protein [Acidiphilium sp.]